MENVINIYTLNDFHGALLAEGDMPGLSRIGKYLLDEKTNKPEQTVILSAGDMFQGTYASTQTRGRIALEGMNIIGFDAMTLGNHEFDWGTVPLIHYQDANSENGEAAFPFLGANIVRKDNGELESWIKPYTVIKRQGLNIGIIGIIGSNLTDSILASMIRDYEFTDEMEAIRHYARILRTEKDCDIVIVSAHADTSSIDVQIAALEDEYYIDAVLNGHTHHYYAKEIRANRSVVLPVVQSGDNGLYIGRISLEIDPRSKKVLDAAAENIPASAYQTESTAINNLFTEYREIIQEAKTVLGPAANTIYQAQAALWVANVLRDYGDADLGIINSGGIRYDAFPIMKGASVTYDNIFRMLPFDNNIVLVRIPGSALKSLDSMNHSLVFSTNYLTSPLRIDGNEIRDEEYYTVATVDYVFEKDYYPFINGEDIDYTGVILRDILIEKVGESVAASGKWYLN